jgi:DNA-binding transcriptional LysR family regulator
MPFPIPLSALRAIEIVARRGALGPAAEELGVTPGAVSQHIRRAEKRLGITLFERTSAGLVPSAALSAQLPRLGEGFSMLASALSALRPDHGGVLTVTLGSVFASRFLVGRLARFSAEHPDLELRLIANGALLDLGRPDIDCGIRFGNGKWPGTTATLLGGIVALPVCTPSLARQLESPADLAHVPVIRDESTMLAWRDWLVRQIAECQQSGASRTDPMGL